VSDIIWVAEIGSMHKGVPSLAFELIRQAKEAGATIAKFQFGWTEKAQELQRHVHNPIRYVDGFAYDLKEWCDYFGIELMASIWSLEGLETARRVGMKRYKIAHQMRDTALIDAIFSDDKPVFWSGERDAEFAIWVHEQYPTYPKQLNLPNFRDKYRCSWYGYSDHTHGIEACLLAVARGALYVEKHFCLDKTDLAVRDTPFSATPAEFSEMVRLGNGLRRLLDA